MADAKSEKQEIKRMGAKPQKNSGRGKYQKGDASLPHFIVDIKEANTSFTLNRNVWGKICTDAARHTKEPALMVCLGTGVNTVRMWIIGDEMFKALNAAYEEQNG